MSWLSKLFGGGSEKRDTTYQGPKPLTSARYVQGGPEYYNTIMNRIQGRNVGFGGNYANKYANPIIRNMRAQYEGYQVPELKSYLSATGRSRGSAGFQQMAQSMKEQALSEGDVFSRLQQRNEDQERAEINQALNDLYNWTGREADMTDRAANFELGLHNQQLSREDQRRALKAQENLAAVNAAAQFIATGFGGGASMNYGGTVPLKSYTFQGQSYQPSYLDPKSQLYKQMASRYGRAGGVV